MSLRKDYHMLGDITFGKSDWFYNQLMVINNSWIIINHSKDCWSIRYQSMSATNYEFRDEIMREINYFESIFNEIEDRNYKIYFIIIFIINIYIYNIWTKIIK